MRTQLARIGPIASHVLTHPGEYRERVPTDVPAGGLTSPRMQRFIARLDAVLPAVQSVVAHAHVPTLRTLMITAALKTPAIAMASDDSLSQFLMHAAHTCLSIGKELLPAVDIDHQTGETILVPIESAAGLVRLLKEAGARQVQSATVHKHDEFVEKFADGVREFRFDPNRHVRDRGPVIAYFCHVTLPQDQWKAQVITPAQLDQLRQASKNPHHISWTSYRDRCGECAAIRAVAALLPQGALDPRRVGWTQPPIYEPSKPLGVQPDDPYAAPESRPTEPADFRVVDAEAEFAHRVKLPGDATTFDGHGGKRLEMCPSAVLLRVRKWIALNDDRATRFANLNAAINHVLNARAARQAQGNQK